MLFLVDCTALGEQATNAFKIGLTATPGLHTTDIFGDPVYTYSYREPAKADSTKATAGAGKPRKQASKPIEKRFEKTNLLKVFRKAIFHRNGLD